MDRLKEILINDLIRWRKVKKKKKSINLQGLMQDYHK